MIRFRILLITQFILFSVSVFCQSNTIDSLKLALKNAKHDTIRCNLLNQLAETAPDEEWPQFNNQMRTLAENKLKSGGLSSRELLFYKKRLANALNNMGYQYKVKGDLTSALKYYNQSLMIHEAIKNTIGISATLNNLADVYKDRGEVDKCIELYRKSLNLSIELKDQGQTALLLNNLGSIYEDQGDIPKSLACYSQSQSIYEKLRDKTGLAYALNNIALVHLNQGDIPKALDYLNQSLNIRKENGDSAGVAYCMNNLGFIYQNHGDPSITSSKEASMKTGLEKALSYFERTLQIREEIGDKKGIAVVLNNIGGVYEQQKHYSEALSYFEKSLQLREEMNNKDGIATSLNNIGLIHFHLKNYAKALNYSARSMKLSLEMGYPSQIRNVAMRLYHIHKATGNNRLALENFELYIKMRDSINSETTRKASIKQQLKYEFDKKSAADSVAHAKESEIKNAELAKQKAEISAKKNQQYALFGGLFGVCVFGVFMFNRYKVTQKQKGIIEEQKEVVEEQKKLVEEKQKEILDSIHYARRIQMAQIPSEKRVQRILTILRKRA